MASYTPYDVVGMRESLLVGTDRMAGVVRDYARAMERDGRKDGHHMGEGRQGGRKGPRGGRTRRGETRRVA